MIRSHRPQPISFAEIRSEIDGALHSLDEGNTERARITLQRLLVSLASDKSMLVQAPPDPIMGPFGRLV